MKPEVININLEKNTETLSYPIFVGYNLFSNAGILLKQYIQNRKIIIIYDTYFSYKNKANKNFNEFINSIKNYTSSVKLVPISGGDETKKLTKIMKLAEESIAYKIDRNSLIIGFGGGVIGDVAGFLASILLRGIGFINIPTTLLAQVDSAVGGKTGVNSKFGKNLIGSFHQPIAVLSSINILKSLPKREFRAGFAEVIKYGLIKDKTFFSWLENEYENILKYDEIKLNKVIKKCCLIKSEIVKNDEKESGSRALLNLGHTFAHAIESFGNYDGRIIHGEAVAIGICLAFKLSNKLGYCSVSNTKRVLNIFKKSKLPTSLKDVSNLSISATKMVEKFRYDKKARNNKLTFILNYEIGKSFINYDMNEDTLMELINEEI